ncbi:eukaryotic translation initiation factor 3 subunit F [Trichonephila inaurata madagascariensis]|uniref:Eukaryotic translation initiation factor 3 subunit F n=1 Tax=Trichonephila inaurata madagascariensis TaxID=2747483 RepID=A0A8X6YEL5_9ARAC|nr:eukaryotic translation initiation factor 3 subunit F [Trichonephila inaurata madagascariensis]
MNSGVSPHLVVKLHPVVLFTIIDSYERRNDCQHRVIGTLLGIYEKGAVEVTNCLCIPHNESEDEVAVDMEFAKAMYELQKKVNSSEVIVGWYATGADVTGHSVLIHDYYSREANNPIHLTVDTSLSEGSLTWKAFTSTSFGVPGKNTGTMFTPCKVEIVGYEPEFVGMKIAQQTKHNKQRSVEILPDLDMINNAIQNMLELSDVVIGYIDDVLANRKPADNSVGRTLMDIVQSIPQISPEQFQDMLNSNMKDLLMVVYLAQLTRSQLALHEKISFL